jgi:hypothetical protein
VSTSPRRIVQVSIGATGMSERHSQAIAIGITFGALAGVLGLLALGGAGTLAPLALAVGVGLASGLVAAGAR